MAQLILGWEKCIPIQMIVCHALFHVNIIATVCKYINKFLKSTSAEPYGPFQPSMTQSIHGWRDSIFLKGISILFSQIYLFSFSQLDGMIWQFNSSSLFFFCEELFLRWAMLPFGLLHTWCLLPGTCRWLSSLVVLLCRQCNYVYNPWPLEYLIWKLGEVKVLFWIAYEKGCKKQLGSSFSTNTGF